MATRRILSRGRTDEFSAHMFDKFTKMRDDGTYTDFSLSVNGSVKACHKMVLSVHSSVLDVMMNTDMKEAASRQIHLPHISGDTLTILMDYMYSGVISVTEDQLQDVLAASHYLQINALTDWCIAQLPDVFKPSDVLQWLAFGDKLGSKEVGKHCDVFMLANFGEVAEQFDFLALEYYTLQQYLRNVSRTYKDHDVVLHDVVLHAVMRWICHDANTRSGHLVSLVDVARLDGCSPAAFLHVMMTYGQQMQSHEEAYSKLKSVAMKQVWPKMIVMIRRTESMSAVHQSDAIPQSAAVYLECWKLNTNDGRLVNIHTSPCKELCKGHSVCSTRDGFAITGGKYSDICIFYNAETATWTYGSTMLAKRHKHGSVSVNGVVYVIGGFVNGRKSRSIHFLDVNSETWQHGPDILDAVTSPTVAAIGGNIYVMCGEVLCEINLSSNNSSACSRLVSRGSSILSRCSMLGVNGKILVAGGREGICVWYNPETDTWVTGRSLKEYNLDGPLVQYNNSVLMLDEHNPSELNLDGTWSRLHWKMPKDSSEYHAVQLTLPPQI